jgi:hypothetical protein
VNRSEIELEGRRTEAYLEIATNDEQVHAIPSFGGGCFGNFGIYVMQFPMALDLG